MTLRALHVWGPGINCQGELQIACEMVGMTVDVRHIRQLDAEPTAILQYDLLCFPGGFSYGDDVGAGKLMANQVSRFLRPAIDQFLDEGKLIFGVCNGFQMLAKAGLLPGPPHDAGAATLTWMDSGRFECRWCHVAPNPENPSPWLKGLTTPLAMPLAHAEGKFVTANSGVYQELEQHHQIAFRYCNPDGTVATTYPACPSGAEGAIAGITDRSGQILGMMPHPERHVRATQSPDWTREGLQPMATCLPLFQNAAAYLQSRVGAMV